MLKRLIAPLVPCVVLVASVTAQVKPVDDAKHLQGTWQAERDMKRLKGPRMIFERVVIQGDKLTFHGRIGDQQWSSKSEFKLNTQVTPKTIDFTPMEGVNKGKTYQGLYEIDDEQVKICYRGPGSTRPKGFSDRRDGNEGTVFIVLKPAKKGS